MMLFIIQQALASNALWNSMNGANITQLYTVYKPIIDNIQSSNLVNTILDTVKTQYSDPVLGPVVFLGVVPIVLSVIALIVCIPINVSVICCNRYRNYYTTQKKLDKKLMKYIKENGIEYNFKPQRKEKRQIMYDVCAQSQMGQQWDVDELNKLHKLSDDKYQESFGCQCWSITFYGMFFALLLIYFIAVVFLWVGAAQLTNMPSTMFSGLQSQIKDLGKTVQSAMNTFDGAVNSVIGSGNSGQRLQVFNALYSGTSEDYAGNLTALKAQALSLEPLKPLFSAINTIFEVNGVPSSNGNKSLAVWLANLIFWPKSSAAYVAEGNAAAGSLTGGLRGINGSLDSIAAAKAAIEKAVAATYKKIQDKINISSLQSAAIPSLTSVVTDRSQKALLTAILQQEIDKYEVANAFFDIVAGSVKGQNVAALKNFLINQTEAGKYVARTKTVNEMLQEFLQNPTVTRYLNGTYLEKFISGKIDNSAIFYDFSKYQPYFTSFNKLEAISLDQFISELTNASCADFWCGIIPADTFTKLNDKLKAIPVLGNMIAYTDKPSQLMSNTKPIIIPLSILICLGVMVPLGLTMGFCLPCCPTFSLFACSVWSILISIISLVFLIISFPNSGIQAISYKIKYKPADLVNQALPIAREFGIFKTEEVNLNLARVFKGVKFLSVEPSQLKINLTDVQSMLSSINFLISVDPSQITGVSSQIKNILDNFVKDLQVNVSLTDMDINKIFKGGKNQNLLNLVPSTNGSLYNSIISQIKDLLQKISLNTVSKLIDDYNITQQLTEKLNVSDYFNVTQIFNDVQQKLNDSNVQKLTSDVQNNLNNVAGIIQPTASYDIFARVTDALKQPNSNVSNILNGVFDKNNIKLSAVDTLHLNLIMQFLSEQGTSISSGYFNQTFLTVQRDPTYYQTISSQYGSALNAFATQYSSSNVCTNTLSQTILNGCTQSLTTRGVAFNTANKSALCKIVCQVMNKIIEADKEAFYPTNNSYNLIAALQDNINTRKALQNITSNISTISNAVVNITYSTDVKNKTSFAAGAEGNLQQFINSVISNINQTLSLKASSGLVTIFDVLSRNDIPKNIVNPVDNTVNQALNAVNAVLSTKVATKVPQTISGVGNSILGTFDNFSIALYFSFLFFFAGCQLCICFALEFVRKYGNERRLKKSYGVTRPGFNCCRGRSDFSGPQRQTVHQHIPLEFPKLYLIS